MAISIDYDLLERLGLDRLPGSEADDLLVFMQDVLLRRVSDVVVSRLTRDQFEEFERAEDQSSWLVDHVPDHAGVVRAEFDLLCAEIASEQQRILAASGIRAICGDDIDWRHGRPDPGGVLVGAAVGACLVSSPLGHVVVAVNGERHEMYARRDDHPAVVLQIPDAHRVDVTSIWCTDDGEVRVRFSEFADLRWRVAARPTAPLRRFTKVLHRRRPDLRWAEIPVAEQGFVEFARGRWKVRDAHNIEVTDRESGNHLTFEQLHDGPHSNAVNPHFTPDGSQLVAVYNVRDDPTQGGAKTCSSHYLETADGGNDSDDSGGDDADRPRTPWQYEVHPYCGPDGPDRLQAGVDYEARIEGVGYDQSSTRAAVVDGRMLHLYELPPWSVIRSTRRADRTARAAQVDLPWAGSQRPCWAGQSVVVAVDDGTVWRLDLRQDLEPQPLPAATRDRAPIATTRSADSAVLVYSDREVVTVDGAGTVETQTLPGDGVILAADMTANGQLLLSTRSSLELWSTGGSTRDLLCTSELTGAAVVGISAAACAAEWAILWHSDQSITTARLSGRSLHLIHRSIPLQTSKSGFTATAIGALMVDVDRWYLIQPNPKDDRPGRTRVAGRDTWLDIPATCLSYLRGAEVIVAGTDDGLSFISRADLPRRAMSPPFDLPGPVTSVATGGCPRSLAVATPDSLWMVRLLV